MNPTPFRSKTTPWRVQVSGRYFSDGKRKSIYFKTLKEATEFCELLRMFGVGAIQKLKFLMFK